MNENIADIYELSPMQQGMLFHTLYAPESGAYFEQLSCNLKGNLNPLAFQQAWQEIVSRHPALRTSFHWEELDKPLQIVHAQVDLPWVQYDWRNFTPIEQQERLAKFLQTDRDRGFELDRAPLMRCTLIQFAEDNYQLIWSHHHILMDGWCLSIILSEISAFYEAIVQGKTVEMQASVPYRSYITWLQQQDPTKSAAFWQKTLQGFGHPTPLLSTKTREHIAGQPENYNKQYLQLSAQTAAAMQTLARQHHLTVSVLIQGAWALLLSRYSGESDVVFGMTVAGRPPELQGVESMVGLFINTLPVRVQLPTDVSVLSWLQNLQAQQVEREQYTYTSLIDIQGWSEIPRGTPLFESIIVFTDYPLDASLQQQIGNLKISDISNFERTNYPLVLDVIPGREFLLGISYSQNLFDATTINRMLQHLQSLLERMTTNPLQCLAELSLLTAAEEHQLLVEWNHTDKKYPQDRCIHQLIEAQVALAPDRVAAVFEDQWLDYRELNQRANQVACALVARGIGKGSYVPVLMDRSIELVIALLAIMKAGAAFVPLDIDWPKARLQQILQELGSPIVLVNQVTTRQSADLNLSVLIVDRQTPCHSQPNLDLQTSCQDPIYVIYTSGSTGTPKGVVVPHQGITNRFFWMNDFFGKASAKAALQTTRHVYDSAVWQIFWPLINGGKTVIPTPEMSLDAENLTTLIHKYGVTIVDFVPSVFNSLVPQLTTDRETIQRLTSLQTAIVGGEEIVPNTTYTFMERFPNVRVVNLYGPTEASIGCICYEVKGQEGNKIPIGQPIANVQVLILDACQNLVPMGVPGELYLTGICLGLGYLNDRAKTAAAFVDNPFPQIGYDKLYKTGDLARYLPNGNIEFLGRIDAQVKIRGHRIELGEIEAVLANHPQVQSNVVMAREDRPGSKRLVAYVVAAKPHEGQNLVVELRHFLQEKLPEQMIPSDFVLLESIPLTAGGKVDRRSLPAPDLSQLQLEKGFVPPRTFVEQTLARIWAEVLKVERVSIHDNFFELGGDSILSIQIIARANQSGLQLTHKQLFTHQTVGELAIVAATSEKIPVKQGSNSGEIPPAPMHRWFWEQSLAEPHHYNQSVLLSVPADLEIEPLEQALQQLQIHHDALRSKFVCQEKNWQQIITDPDMVMPVSVQVIDGGITKEEQEAKLIKIDRQLQSSLNLANGLLLQAALVKMGKNQPQRLLLVIHHLVVDGISWRIILDDLFDTYQQIDRGEKVQLPPKTTSWKDWTHRLTEYAQSSKLASEIDYWRSQTQPLCPALPIDRTSCENTVASAAVISVMLTAAETRSLLQEVPKAYNTQINDVLLAALATVVSKWTGIPELYIELEGHGREDLFAEVDLSRTVGWFTTTFPVRLKLPVTARLGEIIKSVKEQLRQIPAKGIGYGLVRYLRQETVSDLLTAVSPQITFNYLGQFDRTFQSSLEFRLANEKVGADRSLLNQRSNVLEINSLVVNSQLQIDWNYSKNLYQQTTIDRMAQDFMLTLKELIDHCLSPTSGGYTPSDFPLTELSQEELDRLTAELDLPEN
jgi:amino acid adenylation domain-containing protein/non-ribosomal peptide synthase protein (TIGR01720 family)